jgi:hypothetical protein
MLENILLIKTIMQELSILEITLIVSNLIFISIAIFLFFVVTNSIKQSLIIRNVFINFSDRCAYIIDQIKPNVNCSLSNYEEEMQSDFKKLYENLRIDLNQLADTTKKELEKEIVSFQSRLRFKGLEELNKQDILNERVSIN